LLFLKLSHEFNLMPKNRRRDKDIDVLYAVVNSGFDLNLIESCITLVKEELHVEFNLQNRRLSNSREDYLMPYCKNKVFVCVCIL